MAQGEPGDTILDLAPLSASKYHDIKRLEEQRIISNDLLKVIGKIFVESNMHHDYIAGTLHRHFDLDEECLMVHRRRDKTTDICKAEDVRSLERHRIQPNAFFLNSEGRFQAYEYEYTTGMGYTRPLPDREFLHRLRDALFENQLTNLFAVQVEDDQPDSVEYLLSDEQGTICVPRTDVYKGVEERLTITSWKFSEGRDGEIECRERRWCDPKDDGQHQIKT